MKMNIAEREYLRRSQKYERAQKYYDDKFGRAKQFLKGVTFYCEDGDYNMASSIFTNRPKISCGRFP